MKPRIAWTLIAAVLLAGCSTPSWISQSPDDTAEDRPTKDETRLVGTVAVPFGRDAVAVEGIGLVVGLAGTGSDPPPSVYRSKLLQEMRKHQVDDPESFLAQPHTALVLVRGFLRAGVQQGDRFDVEVRVPGRSETTSLRGGYLMATRLAESAVIDGVAREGSLQAIVKGPVMVTPGADEEDPLAAKQGRILGGGVALKSHSLALLLKPDYQQLRYAAAVGAAINRRFHYFSATGKEQIANPKNDELIVLNVHPRYQENVPRYLRVIQALPLKETQTQRLARVELLQRQLLDPLTAAGAAFRLEALGTEGAESLLVGVRSGNAEARFYAAEALAYLGHEESNIAAEALAEAARTEPAFRVFALTALSAMNEFEATEQLRRLLGGESAETRYGAFRALWAANNDDPLVQGEMLGNQYSQFSYHVLASEGPPMIHVTRSFRPEIVLFGQGMELKPPLVLDAGTEIRVNAAPGGPVTVSRFAVGQPDQRRTVSPRVDEVIRTIVELGGTYPDVVQMLQQASSSGALANGRLEIDAVPRAGRRYNRDEEKAESSSRFTVHNPLPNLFPGLKDKPSQPKKRRDLRGRTSSKKGNSELEKLWERVWPW